MKKITFLTFICLLGFNSLEVLAQDWNTSGNVLNRFGHLGTLTGSSGGIYFRANGGFYGILNTSGQWGIGTTETVPGSRLNVSGNQTLAGNLYFTSGFQSIRFANPGATSNPMLFMFTSGTTNPARMVLGHSPAFPNWGLQYTDVADRFDFRNGSSNVLSINLANQRIGINNSNPATTLDILGGNWDVGATEGDVRIGNSTYRLKIGVALGGAGAGDARIRAVGGTNRIMIGTNDALTINGIGNVGIGTINPSRRLEVVGDQRLTSGSGARYLEFFRAGTALGQNDWRFEHNGSALYLSSSSNDFGTFCDVAKFGTCTDTYKFTVFGNALASGGSWQVSDLKLKKDIADFPNAMDMISKLKPKTYFFKTNEYAKLNLSAKKQYGFIAQELEEVMPELVTTSTEVVIDNTDGERKTEEIKAINYGELIPVLVKALQERELRLKKQEQQISELKESLINLSKDKSESSNSGSKTNININLDSEMLGQNEPNPVNSSTKIPFSMPAKVKDAHLKISDLEGREIKTIQLPSVSSGFINLNTEGLAAGVYIYSLVCDGVILKSLRMIVK